MATSAQLIGETDEAQAEEEEQDDHDDDDDVRHGTSRDMTFTSIRAARGIRRV
jgi:hypothetical protein